MSRITKYLVFAALLLIAAFSFYYWYSTTYDSGAVYPEAAIENAVQESLAPIEPVKPSCMVNGQVLKGNQRLFPNASVLLAVSADSTTYDENLGESHRIFTVYDMENCAVKFTQTLPVDVSADYPYYVMPIDSVKGELVAILGNSKFYVYDIINNRMSPALKPTFKGERYLEDAQSGGIVGLETYGKYLVGYTQDQGMFAYNITIPQNPKQEQPFAEYQQEDESHTSLFLLKSAGDSVQAIVPKFDAGERLMSVEPLMEVPQPVSQQITKSTTSNSRFVVIRLRDAKKTPMAIDMKTGKSIEIPEDIKGKANGEIINWLKNNNLK